MRDIEFYRGAGNPFELDRNSYIKEKRFARRSYFLKKRSPFPVASTRAQTSCHLRACLEAAEGRVTGQTPSWAISLTDGECPALAYFTDYLVPGEQKQMCYKVRTCKV